MGRGMGPTLSRVGLLTMILLSSFALSACSDLAGPEEGEASFALTATYDSVRTYPGGGAVFLVRLEPEDGFSGEVLLSLQAASRLGAELDRTVLSPDHPVAEVTLHPGPTLSPGHLTATLIGHQDTGRVRLPLHVEIVDWEAAGISEHAATEKARFLPWLAGQDPAFGTVADQSWAAFQTYPEMLVVEHWTFLSAEWEMRICVHVMIPPHDWSMVRLRRRGEVDPLIAGRRETDGTIHNIALGEYPIFGY